MIKLTVDGFDIEIQTDDENMSVKVLDASGKELSNNSYTQSKEGETDEELVSPDVDDETTDNEDDILDNDEESDDDILDDEESDDEESDDEDDILGESFNDYIKRIKKEQ